MNSVMAVVEVIAVVEGQTERDFVRDVLAPWLGWKGVMLSARLVGKPGHKGGVGHFERAKADIVSLLKERSDTFVTTMFDFYGMPRKWPGREVAMSIDHERKASTVENAIKREIVTSFKGRLDERRLFPYVQMYEFEALLFSKPSALSHVMRDQKSEKKLQDIRDTFRTPEEINDSPITAPSKRIQSTFKEYKKPFHGVLASKRISVETMRHECPHFDGWINIMEELGSGAATG